MSIELWLGVIGIGLSVVGIPLAVVLARNTKKHPTVRTVADFDVLMSSDHGIVRALSIAYGGKDIERVSRTNVAFWNHKGDTIQGVDIVGHDPFRLQLTEGDIALQITPLSVSREQCKIFADIDPDDSTRVLLTFDFLDGGDGGVFEILHLGIDAPVVGGTIRGATIKKVGGVNVDLSPPVLQLIAASGMRRVFAMIKSGGKSRRMAIAGLMAACLPAFILFITYLALGDVGFFREPEVVPIASFDLMSLQGQYEFAQEILDRGKPTSTTGAWALLAMSVVVLFQSFVMTKRAFLPQIPRSIVGVSYSRTPPTVASADTSATN